MTFFNMQASYIFSQAIQEEWIHCALHCLRASRVFGRVSVSLLSGDIIFGSFNIDKKNAIIFLQPFILVRQDNISIYITLFHHIML